jgi:mannose-6-phosphate isomerase-like protein (cupin superfamily)
MTHQQALHLFDISAMDWSEDARFPGIAFKVLESRTTHPAISVALARVDVGKTIPTHVHPIETETVYVLTGEGLLRVKIGDEDTETRFKAGQGGSIPPGLYHSVENVGDVPLQILATHNPPVR